MANEKKQKKVGKKEMAGLLANNLKLMKKFAEKFKDSDLLKEVEEQEKVAKEAMGAEKAIGPCFGCKQVKVVAEKNYEYEYAKWFVCPHKDHFCPDCLKKELVAAKDKRKAAKEAAKKGKK